MIIRATDSATQYLITQPDHAALAAHLIRHWRRNGLPDSPRRSDILLAVEQHDNGWREVDAVPLVDVASGELLDFISAPDDVRRGVWPRGVERLSSAPYAAALVAHHSLQIYKRYRGEERWAPFFVMLQAMRDRYLHATPSSFDDLQNDYFFVRIADLASLTFCNAWTALQSDESGLTIALDGSRLIISPDPFDEREVPISINAREMAARTFDSAAAAALAFDQARTVVLTGVATGVRSV